MAIFYGTFLMYDEFMENTNIPQGRSITHRQGANTEE